MTPRSVDELEVRHGAWAIGDSVPPAILRQRRAALTATRNCVSYALEVLTLSLEVLNRPAGPNEDALQAIIDDLPDLLAGGWENDVWTFSIHTSGSIAIAAQNAGVLDLHEELIRSDLGDPSVTRSRLVRIKAQRTALMARQLRLEAEITQIRGILLRQYASGTASADEWLT
jgi:hypothetical protein